MTTEDQFREEIESQLAAVAGREIFHTMTPGEVDNYLEMAYAEIEMEECRAALLESVAPEIANSVMNSMVSGMPHHAPGVVLDHRLLTDFLKQEAKFNMLKSKFWYLIRMGRNRWNYHLEVAAGWRIVNCGPKYHTK